MLFHTFGKQLIRIITLCVFCTANASAADKGQTINIVGSEWPPYITKHDMTKGAAMDLVTRVFRRAGYNPVSRIETWPRTLEGTKIGIYDVIAAVWYTPERNKKLHYSDPYFENVIRFVKEKGTTIRFRDLSDLKGLIIGVVDNYAYGKEFDDAKGLIKVSNNHVIQNLLLLQQGRIDLTLGDQWVIRNELTRYFPTASKEFEFFGKPVSKRKLHIAVSRANPGHERIIAAFNKALKAMKADGTYAKILARHRKRLIKLQETPL